MSSWNIRYGSWWMVQWQFGGWFSFGIHVDLRTRRAGGLAYGPYIDVHFGCVILSLGYHPALSGELDKVVSISRGGLP